MLFDKHSNYHINNEIGQGKYCIGVFSGLTKEGGLVAIKSLKPSPITTKNRLKKEIHVMRKLHTHPNIVSLLGQIRDEHKTVSLILDHVQTQGKDFSQI